MGNTGSVANALRFLGYGSWITDDPDALGKADAIVLPGVGAFGQAMANLRSKKLDTVLHRRVIENETPFLGICLGMQLLAEDSEELGNTRGLGWLKGHVRAIPDAPGVRVPHVGWSKITYNDHAMFARIDDDSSFYFDHSLRLECKPDYVVATTEHGGPLTAAVRHRHLFATQFHPEKSQRNGLKLLRNFMNYVEGGLRRDAE